MRLRSFWDRLKQRFAGGRPFAIPMVIGWSFTSPSEFSAKRTTPPRIERRLAMTKAIAGSRKFVIPHLGNTERAHRFRIRMRLPFHHIIFDIPAEFIAKHVSPAFPKCPATWRAHEIHDHKLPSAP